MSTAEASRQDISEDTSGWLPIPISDMVTVLWRSRRWLLKITGAGIVVSIGISVLIPNEYKSTARLMPPDAQSIANVSMLSGLSGVSSLASGVTGGLLNARTPGATAIGILSSRTVQDDLINRFDLRRAYRYKLYSDTRLKLADRTTLDEDKKSGILTVSVVDRDRYRARDLAEAYVEELDKLLNSENTSSAHRERVFLEERLISIKRNLDVTSSALSHFSSRNATLSPQTQGQTLMEAAAKLQGELITAESDLRGLKTQYSDDNVHVRQARARVDELQSQLLRMDGSGESENGGDLKPDRLYPSIRELPILGAAYSDLYRQLTMQEGLYETLTKQYELAKVQEAKEIPEIKVLDTPEIPEKKFSPSRSAIVVIGAWMSFLAGSIWIVGSSIWRHISDDNLMKIFIREVRGS